MSTPRRSATAGEPSPPLKAAVDLPLRMELPAGLGEAFEALGEQIRSTAPDADWLERYRRALELVEQTAAALDAQMEAMLREHAGYGTPRAAGAGSDLRRQVEGAQRELQSALQRVVKDWTERTKRQAAQVLEQCTEALREEIPVAEKTVRGGVELVPEAVWWSDLGAFAERCLESWAQQAVHKAFADCERVQAQSLGPLVALARGRVPPAPVQVAAPGVETRWERHTAPVREAEVPSMAGALMQFLRTNLLAVGIFGSVLAVVFVLVGKLGGGGGDDAASGANTMLVRGGLMLAVLPIAVVVGWFAAKRQREQALKKARKAHLEEVHKTVRRALEEIVERQRGELERWLSRQREQCEAVFERWQLEVVEPQLRADEERATQAANEAKLAQTLLGERISSLRMLRKEVGDKILVDLKRRHRELEREAATVE